MIKRLFYKIRKHPFVNRIGYAVYDLMLIPYLKVSRLVHPAYGLERATTKYLKEIKKHKLEHVSIINGTPYITHHNLKFTYIPESRGGNISALYDPAEEEISKIIFGHLKHDSILMDVGANFGVFTIPASKKITDGKIYAFEPVSETFNYLKKNVLINNLSGRVIASKIALSDKDSTAIITTNKFGRNHITNSKGKYSEQTEIMKLDTFVSKNSISHVDFIKCDVEGHELFVLKGALKTIHKHHPALVLEIQDNWIARYGYKPKDIFDLLRKEKYKYKLITKDHLENSSNYKDIPKDLEKAYNFLFY